jgi:hypothetical protein
LQLGGSIWIALIQTLQDVDDDETRWATKVHCEEYARSMTSGLMKKWHRNRNSSDFEMRYDFLESSSDPFNRCYLSELY